MIYTVTMNPSLDYIVSVPAFQTGQVNRTSAEQIYAGGKGINVSMVLKNLGYDSVALGFTAGFTGERIIQLLEQSGIRQDFISIHGGFSRINVKIRSDAESEINGQGPVIGSDDMQGLYHKLNKLVQDDILVLAGSIPSSVPSSVYMDIMQYLQQRKVRVVVDATKELLLNVLPLKPFLVKPNHYELGELFGVCISNRQEALTYAQKLRERGARNVLVSMAGAGAVMAAEDGSVFQAEAPKGIVKNSVGAGDSMVAGFLAGFLTDGSYHTAFKMGICTGSASAFSEQLATKEEVLDLLNTKYCEL